MTPLKIPSRRRRGAKDRRTFRPVRAGEAAPAQASTPGLPPRRGDLWKNPRGGQKGEAAGPEAKRMMR